MQNNYTSKGKHLTESERLLIERWHNKEKISNREIAYRLGNTQLKSKIAEVQSLCTIDLS